MLLFRSFRFTVLILTFFFIIRNSFGQSPTEYNVKELRDIAYSEGRTTDTLQRLNLVLPTGVDNCPLLIWIGGGAWSYVDRNVEMDLARKFAQKGIAVASVGHRLSAAKWRNSSLSSGVKHPAHVKDVAASLKWLYDNASEYAYNRDNFFVGGYSSGAHLAALIGLDDSYLSDFDLSLYVIRGLIPISGTYDVKNYFEVFKSGSRPELAELHVKAVFGETEQDFISASPTSYLENLGIPMLLISDNALDGYTRLFEKKLSETDYKDYTVIYVTNLNHGELWKNISLSDSSNYRAAMISFIRKNSL